MTVKIAVVKAADLQDSLRAIDYVKWPSEQCIQVVDYLNKLEGMLACAEELGVKVTRPSNNRISEVLKLPLNVVRAARLRYYRERAAQDEGS